MQIVAFLAGLRRSDLLPGPVLVVCPATILQQWVKEFHTWWPTFRVCVLHDSGTWESSKPRLVRSMQKDCILVTTYSTLRLEQEAILEKAWSYVVLDEGDRIKNPDAAITQVVAS